MKKGNCVLNLGLFLILLVSACSGKSSTARVENAGLFKDPAGNQSAEAYGWLDIFYCVVSVADPSPGTTVKASWVAVDTDRTSPNTVIKIEEKAVDSSPVIFELKNEGNFWPTGTYQVYLYLDGNFDRVIDFRVVPGDIP